MAAFELEANIGRQPYAGDLPFYLKQALEGAAVALVFREGGIPRPKDNALTPRSMLKTTRLASRERWTSSGEETPGQYYRHGCRERPSA